MIPEKEKVLPLVDCLDAGGWKDPVGVSEAQRDADWSIVLALVEALEWALAEGGLRLPHYAMNVPAVIKVPPLGAPAEIDWDVLTRPLCQGKGGTAMSYWKNWNKVKCGLCGALVAGFWEIEGKILCINCLPRIG